MRADEFPIGGFCWAGASQAPLKLTSPVPELGWMNSFDLSAHLQLTDVFLIPTIPDSALSEALVIAALQHGLAVVGTRGYMTDKFWQKAEGVALRMLRTMRL